jgi:hypothetical protein
MRLFRLALVVVSAFALLGAASAGADNEQVFPDSLGEGGGDVTVPDIIDTTVKNDNTGLISIAIRFANVPSFTRDALVDVLIDSDSNSSTGDPELGGTDYAIELLLGEANLFKWDGTALTRRAGDPPATTLRYAWVNNVLTITISAGELGNTKKFGFAEIVLTGLIIDDVTGDIDFTKAKADSSPGGGAGFFSYEVKIAPAKLVAKKVTTTPSAPKAGGSFTVRLTATRSDTGAAIVNGTVDCAARAGTRAMPPKSEKFVAGAATCVFKVPARTKGKRIRGTIKITFEGKTLTRTFTATVR